MDRGLDDRARFHYELDAAEHRHVLKRISGDRDEIRICPLLHGADLPREPEELARDMERVGWQRSGESGRIKASAPGRSRALGWSFYLVRAGWETR